MSRHLYCRDCGENVVPKRGSNTGWLYACECEPPLTAALPYDGSVDDEHDAWDFRES